MSEMQPTAFDGLDSGSVSELATTGARVWDSPAVGSHAQATSLGWAPHPTGFSVPERARTLVPRELFFV